MDSDDKPVKKNNKKKNKAQDTSGLTQMQFQADAVALALKKMDKVLASQVVISAVSMNTSVFVSTLATACELMWVKSLLDVLDRPDDLRRSGYSAQDVCTLVSSRGYFIEKNIREKAKEIDGIHQLKGYQDGIDKKELDSLIANLKLPI
jgi:hypothetical protein